MPELPDVELFRRYLDQTCKGRVLRHVAANDPKMLAGISSDAFAAKVEGSRVLGSRRHGKAGASTVTGVSLPVCSPTPVGSRRV